MEHTKDFRCGFVAIVGRPNVGKSTLLNRLIGLKLSIVSRRAQTTRHRVNGILTQPDRQFVFVDTPGYQKQHLNALNRTMNRSVTQALGEVDVIVVVVDSLKFGPEDQQVIDLLPKDRPVILAVNKVNRVLKKDRLLPVLEKLATLFDFRAIVPVSAQTGQGKGELLKAVGDLLPHNAAMFDDDDITDASERFLAAEFLREKLFRRLGEELPYGMAVEIEKFEMDGALRRISAAIIVDQEGHKAIVIGASGERMKAIATDARKDMEKLFGGKVFLEVWVKVKSGWADDARALKSLGYQ